MMALSVPALTCQQLAHLVSKIVLAQVANEDYFCAQLGQSACHIRRCAARVGRPTAPSHPKHCN
jgi:hypothetical protein